MPQIVDGEASRLDMVYRASVRDPDDPREPMRWPVFRSEEPPMPTEAIHAAMRSHAHTHNGSAEPHTHSHLHTAATHDAAPHPHAFTAKATDPAIGPSAANPDPDGDGDDDTSPETDTDHDYWNPDGTPTAKGKAAGLVAKAEAVCPLCKGTGTIRDGHVTCPDCGGSGKLADVPAAKRQAKAAPYAPTPYRADPDETVICPKDHAHNDFDAQYCDQCGFELAGSTKVVVGGQATGEPYDPQPYRQDADETVICPVCHKHDDTDAKFCDQCGTKLTGRTDVVEKAEWTTAQENNLPDASFAYIEPGGTKDAEGKTVPRDKRHFPYKGPDGKVDLPHLRDALGRAPQSPFGPKAMPALQAAARASGVGKAEARRTAAARVRDWLNRVPAQKAAAPPTPDILPDAVRDAITELADDASAEGVVTMPDGTEPTAGAAPPADPAASPATPDAVAKGERVEISKAELTALQTQVAEAQAIAKFERDQRVDREFLTKAEALTHVPGDRTEIAKAMRQISDAAPEAYATVETVLKAANEGLRQSRAFQAIGSEALGSALAKGDAGAAWSQVKGLAAEIRKTETKLSEAQALDRAMRQLPEQASTAIRAGFGAGRS